MDPVATSRLDLERAQEARSAGDAEGSLTAIRRASFRRPDHPGLLLLQARSEAMAGELDASLASLRRLVDLDFGFDAAQDPQLGPLQYWPGFDEIASRLSANAAPQGSSQVVLRAGAAPFLPEGLAYDPIDDAWFLGSVHLRKILRLEGGEESVFADASDGLLGVFGLAIDPNGRRLWVCSGADPVVEGLGADQQGKSELIAFDLDDGSVIGRWSPQDEGQHLLGDLVVTPDSEVFLSDSRAGAIYLLRKEHGSLERFATSSRLHSPQGLALTPAGDTLLVADYASGLWTLDLKSRRLQPLPAPAQHCLLGIDGLARSGSDLIAVQNGFEPQRILRLRWDEQYQVLGAVEVLAAALPGWREPTLGKVVDGHFYFVANSHWPDFAADGSVDGDQGQPEIQRLKIP